MSRIGPKIKKAYGTPYSISKMGKFPLRHRH